jgi:hypothetical protein
METEQALQKHVNCLCGLLESSATLEQVKIATGVRGSTEGKNIKTLQEKNQ